MREAGHVIPCARWATQPGVLAGSLKALAWMARRRGRRAAEGKILRLDRRRPRPGLDEELEKSAKTQSASEKPLKCVAHSSRSPAELTGSRARASEQDWRAHAVPSGDFKSGCQNGWPEEVTNVLPSIHLPPSPPCNGCRSSLWPSMRDMSLMSTLARGGMQWQRSAARTYYNSEWATWHDPGAK